MIARTRVETIGRCLPPESGKICTLFYTIALTVGAMAGLTVGGSIGAGGSLSIASGAAGVALEMGAIVTGATIAMTATGPFALGDGTVLGQLGATVDLSTSAGSIA